VNLERGRNLTVFGRTYDAGFPEKMMNWSKSPQVVSFLFYLGVGILFLFPCLFGGQVFFDGDLLNSYHIFRKFISDQLLQGHFPLWNPYLYGGQPCFGDGNFMACYPFLLFSLPFPVDYGFSIFYLTCLVIAALGMHFWLKGLGLSVEACRLGAVLFSLSGYFWWEIIHPPEMAALVWMPWWAGALERVSRRLSMGWAFLAGLFFMFLFTAGNFQLTLAALYGGIFYFVFLIWARRPWSGKDSPLRAWMKVTFAFSWGALPLLAFWIPAWEFMSHCGRLLEQKDYRTFLADYSIDPFKIWHFIFPSEAQPGVAQGIPEDSLSNAGYLGPWALFFVFFSFSKPKDRQVHFLGLAALGALALACGRFLPFHRLVCDWVPGFGLTRAPFRYICLYVGVLSFLTAVGFDRFRNHGGKGKKYWFFLPLIYGAFVLAFALSLGGSYWVQGVGALTGGGCLWALMRFGQKETWSWIFLLSVVWTFWAADSHIRTSRMGPISNFNWEERSPLLLDITKKTGLARTFLGDKMPYPILSQEGPVTMDLPTDAAMVTGLRNDSGYNPLCLKVVSDLFSLPAGTHVKLMAVKSFVTGNPSRLKGFRSENWGGVHYFENTLPVSFVYAPLRVQTVSSDQDRLALMGRPDFDPYRISFLSQSVPVFVSKEEAGLTYALEKGTTDQETFKVSLKRPGYAVFSEVMFPGWKALVDGKPSTLFTANHAFRALWLEAGGHQVEFRYEPAWVAPILWGLILWVLSLGLWRLPAFRRWAGSD
jgi:hypothetical protein